MREVIGDLRYAARALWRHRAFTIAISLTLAVGFGATAAVVSVYRAALLRPLPVAEPDRLVFVHRFETRRGFYSSCSYPAFVDYRERLKDQVDLAAYLSYDGLTFDQRGRVPGAMVSDGYFRVAGIAPLRGRLFTPADRLGAVIISERLWVDVFGRDESVVGRAVRIQRRAATIVGVVPASFPGFDRDLRAEIWLPLEADDTFEASTRYRGRDWLEVVGRLRPGVSREGAEATLRSVGLRLASEHPETDGTWRLVLSQGAQGNVSPDQRDRAAHLLVVIGAQPRCSSSSRAGRPRT